MRFGGSAWTSRRLMPAPRVGLSFSANESASNRIGCSCQLDILKVNACVLTLSCRKFELVPSTAMISSSSGSCRVRLQGTIMILGLSIGEKESQNKFTRLYIVCDSRKKFQWICKTE